jgi:hypothetical protein
LAEGIEIQAEFQAQKVSNPEEGPRYYRVILTIDPEKRGVRGRNWCLTKSNSVSPSAYNGPKNRLRWLETKIRDEVLKYRAWAILTEREPDPNYIVNEVGEVIVPEPFNRRV